MDSQAIWFCGFYEGEGSVSNDISNADRLRLSISQNDSTPLYEAMKRWGGSVRPRVRISLKGKECHGNEWRLSHHQSLKFLKDIRPFMKIPRKIEQVKTAIERFNNYDGSFVPYQCDFCDKKYSNPSGRRRHIRDEHKNENIEFECSECNKNYKTKCSTKRHIKEKHPNASIVEIQLCETSKSRETP